MQYMVKVITVFHHLSFTVNVSSSTGEKLCLYCDLMLQELGTAYVFTLWVCGLVECGFCVFGNYCDLNAGSAGETGCLLINEWSRWPRVGGSCEHTASRSGGQHNTDTWAATNKRSQVVDTSQRHQACVRDFTICLYMYGLHIMWPLKNAVSTCDPLSYVVHVFVVCVLN